MSVDPAANPLVLYAVLEHVPGLLWTVDCELRCSYVSKAPPLGFGLRAGDPIGETQRAAHQRALAGEVVCYEVSCGSGVFDCRVGPLASGDGTLTGVIGSAQEIAAQRLGASGVLAPQGVFQSMLEHAADGIAILDAQGRFIFMNSAARHLADVEPIGTVISQGSAVWGNWFHGSGAPLLESDWPLLRAFNGHVTQGLEVCKTNADGSRHHLLFSAAPVCDANGAIIGAIATFSDITARRRSEDAMRAMKDELEVRVSERTAELERSRQQLLSIINNSTAVIYLKDPGGRYQLVNRQFEKLFKITNENIAGRTDYDFLPADVARAVRANDERVVADRVPIVFEEVVPHDGGDHTYISVKFPLCDANGVMYGVCGMSTDITERKRMEAELQRSEALLGAVIESSSDPIWSVDRDFRLTTFNSVIVDLVRSVIGVEPRLGALMTDFVPAALAQRWRDRLERARAGERFVFEETLRRDGANQHFLVCVNPMWHEGEVAGMTMVAKDITELKRAEEQGLQHQADLAQVLRVHTLGQMAASLAHEINQPLGAIASYAQGCRNWLKSESLNREKLVEAVEQITGEALRAGAITRRVRDMLRKDRAKRQDTELNHVVRNALGMAESTARRNDVTLALDASPEWLVVRIDAIQIEQVLLNLLLNAIDAAAGSPNGRREVKVRTRGNGAVAEVDVSDTGAGIDPGLGDKLFEPFYTTKATGLGMGLAISRSIVDAHGGDIAVESSSEPGACFRFRLPLATRKLG